MTDKQVTLITGAGRGIGRGIALGLAERGWAVAVNYRENLAAAQETADKIRVLGGIAQVFRADIGLSADRERLLAETLQAFDQINLLVNNAGMGPRQRLDLLETTESSFDEVMDVNLKGPFFLTQAVARVMVDNLERVPAPQIVNIGSISAYTSSTNRGEYCISKAGLAMMTRLFADRLAEYGIRVYEIRPGVIATDLTQGVKGKYDALIEGGLTPIKRWGEPRDIARAVVAIAEGYLPFSTGEVINVDGGFHLHRL